MSYFIAGMLVGSGIGYMIGHIKTIAYCTRELEKNILIPLREKVERKQRE